MKNNILNYKKFKPVNIVLFLILIIIILIILIFNFNNSTKKRFNDLNQKENNLNQITNNLKDIIPNNIEYTNQIQNCYEGFSKLQNLNIESLKKFDTNNYEICSSEDKSYFIIRNSKEEKLNNSFKI